MFEMMEKGLRQATKSGGYQPPPRIPILPHKSLKKAFTD
jgi:hypothetical protein